MPQVYLGETGKKAPIERGYEETIWYVFISHFSCSRFSFLMLSFLVFSFLIPHLSCSHFTFIMLLLRISHFSCSRFSSLSDPHGVWNDLASASCLPPYVQVVSHDFGSARNAQDCLEDKYIKEFKLYPHAKTRVGGVS